MVKKFNRINFFKYKKNYFYLHINRNDNLYDIYEVDVKSWKKIVKKHKTFSVPDQIETTRRLDLLNKLQGNQYKVVVNKLQTMIDLI
jgi:hypothetical protein